MYVAITATLRCVALRVHLMRRSTRCSAVLDARHRLDRHHGQSDCRPRRHLTQEVAEIELLGFDEQ